MQIYKICALIDYEDQQATGIFKGVGIDARDGYIHFSTAELLPETLKLYFKGQSNLIVFSVHTEDMPEVKWEEARGGKLFPHVYGQFSYDKIQGAHSVQVLEEGEIIGLQVA